MSGWDTQDGGPGGSVSVILARSTDRCASWSSSVVRDARGKTGPQTENHSAVAALAVDTKAAGQDVVYVGWRAGYPQAAPFPGGLRAHRPPLVAVSTDGGKTFGEPVDVSSFYKRTSKGPTGADLPLGMGFTAPSLAVDGQGALYVASGGCGLPFDGSSGQAADGAGQVHRPGQDLHGDRDRRAPRPQRGRADSEMDPPWRGAGHAPHDL